MHSVCVVSVSLSRSPPARARSSFTETVNCLYCACWRKCRTTGLTPLFDTPPPYRSRLLAFRLASCTTHKSGKVAVLMALLNGFREVKDRSVVFSQSLKSLDMIQSLLEKSDPPFQCLRIDGSTPQITRERLIKRSVSHSATVAIPSCCHTRARPTLLVTVCCLSTILPPLLPYLCVCVVDLQVQ